LSFQKSNYIDVSANEVTIVDAKRWINIHAYVMKYLKHVPISLMLEWIVVGAISINIKDVIVDAMGSRYGGLNNQAMASK
jgi:hypothetical protein